jgi:hypothetical protein
MSAGPTRSNECQFEFRTESGGQRSILDERPVHGCDLRGSGRELWWPAPRAHEWTAVRSPRTSR